MWIRGLEVLTKPLLQLATQHHKEIPWETIDMDFMNLNQAAHGDREFGYMVSRLGIPRKIVVGHYTDPEVAEKVGTWARACAGWNASQNMKVMRWGDNMRNVAVTEGDKTEAERVFGASINTWAVNELVAAYSYNFTAGNELDMGSHMLEVSPSIGTIAKPKLAIYPLGIGGKSDPVRLVFSGKPGDAVVVSMADERERFRLLMDEVSIVEPQGSLKNLPCARAVWKPKPDLKTAVQCWIAAGGSHHTCMTTSVGREAWEDFARIAGVELAVIDENTTARQFEKELQLSEMYHRLNNRH